MEKMLLISEKYCQECYLGRIFEGEDIVRCIKRERIECPHKKEINRINEEIEIILY